MAEYITSDWHLGHKNSCGPEGIMIKRSHFDSVESMDRSIIEAVNKVLTEEDTLYHLGDISLSNKPKDVFDELMKINGQLVICKGNHDNSKLLKYLEKFNSKLPNGKPKFVIHEVGLILKRDGLLCYLTHYPMVLGEGSRNVRSLCGHIHEEKSREAYMLNIGIDSPEIPSSHPFGAPLELTYALALSNRKWEGK